MCTEELKGLRAGLGVSKTSWLMKKPGDHRTMVIDLDDEIEKRDEAVTVAGKHNEAEKKTGTADNPICFWPMFQKVETSAASQGLGIEISNGKKDTLHARGIDLNAEIPEAMKIETNAASLGLGKVVRREEDISRATGIDLDDPDVLAAIMDDDMDCYLVDTVSQQAEVVDLSSSESGDEGDGDDVDDDDDGDDVDVDVDEGDGDDGDIHASFETAEDQEEIITTLSREDAVIFADVMKVIKEGGDLRKFKVDHLKTYLRHHGLRIVGLKLDLLERIHKHLSIKDGQAEQKYPRASFNINCKGDVCLGDTVLFLQTVYDMPSDYGIGSASGPPLGKRWVAGKVVSESYGAGRQQHTFTIEVMWSSGVQPFYCMRPLRIKGRNLYRMVTMRQPWSNEAERQKVLDEKHARGAAARAIRRAVKGLKSKGKSRADSRVHPHNPASPSTQPSLNSMLQGRNPPHSQQQQNEHQGNSINSARDPLPNRVHPQDSSMQHGKRPFHSQQNDEHQGDTNHPGRDHPGPPKRARLQQDAVQNGRRFHSRQNEHSGHDHVTAIRAHVQAESMQHGSWVHSQRQVHNQFRSQGIIHVPCSNSQCEKAGAKQCITRSCASCCSRDTTSRGRCQRHR